MKRNRLLSQETNVRVNPRVVDRLITKDIKKLQIFKKTSKLSDDIAQ